jgi:hypothetical protein
MGDDHMYEHNSSNYIQRWLPGLLAETQTFSFFIDIFEFEIQLCYVWCNICY